MTATRSRDTTKDMEIELRWEWRLANGGLVVANIDAARNLEIVSQSKRVLSQATRGQRPDGHKVLVSPERDPSQSERPPVEAVVTFGTNTAVCILRVDDQEVAPSVWPVRRRREPAVDQGPPQPIRTYALLGLGAVLLLAVGFAVRAFRGDSGAKPQDSKLEGTYRSLNGLFVAHYPNELEPKLAVMPAVVGAVMLEDKLKTIDLIIASLNINDAQNTPSGPPRDPWMLQQAYRDEAIANLPKGSGRWEETARREDTCLGKSGAVVTGQIMVHATRTHRVWSCAFMNDNAGYLILYMLAEPAGTADERRARAVLEATELTRLADLGTIPPALIANPTGSGAATGASPGDLGQVPQIGSGSLPKLELPQ